MKRRSKRFDNGGSVMDSESQDMRNPAYRKQLEQQQALQEPPISPEDFFVPGLRKASSIAKTLQYGKHLASRPKPDTSGFLDAMKYREKLADEKKRVQDYYNKENQRLYGTREKRLAASRAEAESDHFTPGGPYKKSTDVLADRVEKEGREAYLKRYNNQVADEINQESRKKIQKRILAGKVGEEIESRVAPRAAGTLGNMAMEAEDQAAETYQEAIDRIRKENFQKKRRKEKPDWDTGGLKKGGKVKSASARADGCAIRGKTRA